MQRRYQTKTSKIRRKAKQTTSSMRITTSPSDRVNHILYLQRTLGNQAVMQMMAQDTQIQRDDDLILDLDKLGLGEDKDKEEGGNENDDLILDLDEFGLGENENEDKEENQEPIPEDMVEQIVDEEEANIDQADEKVVDEVERDPNPEIAKIDDRIKAIRGHQRRLKIASKAFTAGQSVIMAPIWIVEKLSVIDLIFKKARGKDIGRADAKRRGGRIGLLAGLRGLNVHKLYGAGVNKDKLKTDANGERVKTSKSKKAKLALGKVIAKPGRSSGRLYTKHKIAGWHPIDVKNMPWNILDWVARALKKAAKYQDKRIAKLEGKKVNIKRKLANQNGANRNRRQAPKRNY